MAPRKMEINRIIGPGDWWRTPIKRLTTIVTRTTTTVQCNTHIARSVVKTGNKGRNESRGDHVQWALNMRDYICPAALFDCPGW